MELPVIVRCEQVCILSTAFSLVRAYLNSTRAIGCVIRWWVVAHFGKVSCDK